MQNETHKAITHRMILNNFGPVKECEINLTDMLILSGPQANGKSTIAKAIFFFRTIKEDILDMMIRGTDGEISRKWKGRLTKRLKDKFMQLFGSSYGMSNAMKAVYYYTDKTYIQIDLSPNYRADGGPNYINVTYSDSISRYLSNLNKGNYENMSRTQLEYEQDRLVRLFSDEYETIFIPAGRSIITLLTMQLNYIFTTMSENQKRNIDYCTQRYVDLILRLRPSFSHGLSGALSDKLHLSQKSFNVALVKKTEKLINEILKGRYQNENGEERLYLENSSRQYVKINFASSGQQETVWITNILFYYLLENKRVFLIVEEPETHLYPAAQKQIAELLALFMKNGNCELITTHSPYILGEFNNLIYACEIYKRGIKKVSELIDSDLYIDSENMNAYHLNNGELCDMKEESMGLIRNESIEGASADITDECDALYEISSGEEEIDYAESNQPE